MKKIFKKGDLVFYFSPTAVRYLGINNRKRYGVVERCEETNNKKQIKVYAYWADSLYEAQENSRNLLKCTLHVYSEIVKSLDSPDPFRDEEYSEIFI
jgi:hypothetical protein